MQLTEIGVAATAAAIGFLILGSTPPPEIEASAQPGGDVDLPLFIGTSDHPANARGDTVLGACPNLAALPASLPASPDPMVGRDGSAWAVTAANRDSRELGTVAGTCAGCQGGFLSDAGSPTACASRDMASLTLRF